MKSLKPGEAAIQLGVSTTTLYNWEKNGTLVAYRTPTNRRFYTQEQIDEMLEKMIGKRETDE